jgi:serine/threonine protein kinase
VEGLEELIQQHQQLLWDDIPRALMPHFKLEDPTIVESENAVGSYRLVKQMQTNIGTVVEGLDINNRHMAIKVLNKTTILTPGEVEGVYREYRFLMELLVHPHIAKCIEMLHSTSNIYLVMEYGGSSNLQQLLVSHPGQRLEANPAWDCFAQVLDGLAYCHVKQVAHRSICPEHVVISLNRSSRASLPSDSQPLSQGYVSHAAKQSEPGESSSQQVNAVRISSGYHCRLVDFHCAILKKGEWQSQSACSNFPCMSPEMASGESYHCGSSDCWSLGIVLLEMAGGLGSLAAFTGTDFSRDIVDPADIAPVISRSFVEPGSQQRALSMLGATPSVEIVSAATDLLRPEPENRRPLDQMFSALREEGKL